MSASSTTTTIDLVIELQNTHNELRAAEELLGGIPDWMEELHQEYSTRKAEIDAIQESIDTASAQRRTAEAGIADAQEKLLHYQDQIGRVRNQREYSALLQEIDVVKQAIQGLENDSLQALETMESEGSRLEEAQQAFEELETRYNEELAKWEAQKPDVAANAEKLRSHIDELRSQLPDDAVRSFDAGFERFDGTALASIQLVQRPGKGPRMYHCSACNYRVLPQAVVEVRNNGTIVHCDSCKRILFFEEAEG